MLAKFRYIVLGERHILAKFNGIILVNTIPEHISPLALSLLVRSNNLDFHCQLLSPTGSESDISLSIYIHDQHAKAISLHEFYKVG
jgi:hypothetical protein